MSSSSSSSSKSLRDRLPPTPEDYIVLGGDVVALFTYAFLDHALASLVISESKPTFTEPDSLLVPVWSDISTHNFGQSFLEAVLSEQQMAQMGGNQAVLDLQQSIPHYAPCLNSFGVSSVVLVSCWLLSGWFNRAFCYQNTISCEPSHAILVTGKTWVYAATMMVGLAYWSSNCFCPNHTAGMSTSDADFIFDTFTVLVMWRYMASLVLGRFM